MPDVFDQLDEEKDIFDQIESEPVEFTPPDERWPRGTVPTDFVEPPPRPVMGEGPEDIPPGMSAGLPPRPTEAQWEQVRKQSRLGEEIAGTMAEAEIVGNAERAINLAQEGIISPKVAEMALAVGAPAIPPGVRRSLAEAGSGLTSPVNAGLMLATGAGSVIPKIGGAVARGVAGGFAADIATHMPELGTAAGEASVTGTPEEQQKAIADIALSAGMGGLAGAGVFHRAAPPIPPRIIETIAKADAIGLNRSAQAYADTVKQSQRSAATTAVETKPTGRATYRGTDMAEWEAIQNGESFGTTIGQTKDPVTGKLIGGQKVDSTWTIEDRDYAARYASGSPSGVLIEFKPDARSKMQTVITDSGPGVARDNRLNGKGLTLNDVSKVYDSSGKVIYDAARARGDTIRRNLSTKPSTQGVTDAIQEPPATESLLRQERPDVELQEVRQPQAEIVNAIPREPARGQGGEAAEVLLTDRVAAMTPEEFGKAARSGEFGGSVFFTKAAQEAGREARTVESIAKLKEHEAAAIEEYNQAVTAEDAQRINDASAKKQFFSEAVESATGASEFKGSDPVKFRALRDAGQPVTPVEPLPEPAGPKAGGEQPTPAASRAVPRQDVEDFRQIITPQKSAELERELRKDGWNVSAVAARGRLVDHVEIFYRAKKLSEADTMEAGWRKVMDGEVAPPEGPTEYQKFIAAELDARVAAKAQSELPGTEAETQGAIATAGPPLMPVSPAGAPAPVKPISQIIRDLARGLDVPIRFGRLTTSKYAGYFKKNPNLIGAKLANDMPIVAHEGGHKLDAIYPFTKDASLRPELEALGDPAIAGSRSSWTPSKSGVYKRSEGFAEFVRHWLTDPAEALRLAPDTHAVFERVLAANEDLGNVMRQAQSDIQIWRNAPQEGRLDSSISRSDPNKSRYRFPNLLRDVVDDLHFLRIAVDDAKVSGNLPPSQNPYQLARTLRGSFGMADTFIRKGITDFKTKEVKPGTGLEDALKPISGRMDEFRRWIVARRARELRGQGKETGLNAGDVDFVANKYNSEPAFQEAFTKVKAWNDGLLQYAVDSGLIAPDSAAAMRTLHQDYVPFHRLFEVGAGESPAVAGGGVGRGLNAGKPGSLKRLSGSQRDIVDPLETMVKNAYTMITAAEKNAINTAVADLAPKTDMGRWVERVAAPKEMVKVELERIRKQLDDAGADLTGVPDDLLMGFFKPSGRAPFGENIIKVNRAGKQEFYRLDKELFDTFNALDQDASSRLLKLMSAPAQLLRAGVTLTPDFALSNAFRDTIGAAVLSKYTTYPFQATVRGLGAMLNNPKLVSEWAASGGKQSVEANYFDRAKLQKFLTDKITKDLTPAEQALVVAKSPLTALRMITGTLEEATRIGEYKAALKKLTDEGMPIGDARRQAAFEARDLQDFAKGGAQTKIVRSLAAFWNAGLQGNVRLAQSFKQRPFQTTLKGLAFITLPKLLEQALNWDDEDYWDRPQWERDLFFMIPRGKDENGHTQFIRLPTPFEMGVIFGTVPGRILQAIREKNPKSLESLPGVMLRQTAPNPTPQSVLTLLEVNAGKSGYSFFRDRPIVPSSLKNAPPELQFTAQNSLTAKKVGRLLGVAPAKVDYAIGGLTGGVGKQLTHQVADRAIAAVTGEKRSAQSTMPGARFVATPAGVQSESVERFYKALEEANADAERVKAGEASQGQAKRAPRLNVIARRISELRKQAREEQNPQARQRINLRIAEIAKEAITP